MKLVTNKPCRAKALVLAAILSFGQPAAAGGLFAIRELGVRGLPEPRFAG